MSAAGTAGVPPPNLAAAKAAPPSTPPPPEAPLRTGLDDDARAALLERAIRIEACSLARYFARNAPPVDLAKRPEVARALESIARAEEDGVRELASRIEEIGGAPARSSGYDPRFTIFNDIASPHALDVLAKRLAEASVALEALAKEAGEDIGVAPAIAEALARKREHAALVADLRGKRPPPTGGTPA